jgi:hypothetical protein
LVSEQRREAREVVVMAQWVAVREWCSFDTGGMYVYRFEAETEESARAEAVRLIFADDRGASESDEAVMWRVDAEVDIAPALGEESARRIAAEKAFSEAAQAKRDEIRDRAEYERLRAKFGG